MEENEEKSPADITALSNVMYAFDSKQYIKGIKDSIMEGNVNSLDAIIIIKKMAKVSEELIDDPQIKELVIAEADKFLSGSNKTFKYRGATITKMAVHTWYDFSECNHPELIELNTIKAQIETRIKILEDELKLLIPKESNTGMFLTPDTKTIVVERMPVLNHLENEDQVIVKAPEKKQKIGLKFMKI